MGTRREGPNALDILFTSRYPSQKDVALQPRGEGDPPTEHCKMCGAAIKTMIFRGSEVCGEQCRKRLVVYYQKIANYRAAVEQEKRERNDIGTDSAADSEAG